MPTVTVEPVDVHSKLSTEDFYANYVNKRPVVIRGAIADLPAVRLWSLDYLGSLAPDLSVRLKTGSVADGMTTVLPLAEYCRIVTEWEASFAACPEQAGDPPAYLHDLPLLRMIPSLRKDLTGFQAESLPRFFRSRWWDFTQFFVGPSRAVTPLHFDTLLTHNTFLQVRGTKRFVMVDASDCDHCYITNWRWSPIDPEAPDEDKYPRFSHAHVRICEVTGGDLLYMPPGTLHKVTSLTAAVSFNVDWHDRYSAVRGLTAARRGMPARNLRYNLLFALGVIGRLPHGILMPGLRSYYSYIS